MESSGHLFLPVPSPGGQRSRHRCRSRHRGLQAARGPRRAGQGKPKANRRLLCRLLAHHGRLSRDTGLGKALERRQKLNLRRHLQDRQVGPARASGRFHIWHVNSFSPFFRAEQDFDATPTTPISSSPFSTTTAPVPASPPISITFNPPSSTISQKNRHSSFITTCSAMTIWGCR